MGMIGLDTANIGVQRFYPMDQAMRMQKLQRPIYGGRGGLAVFSPQRIEYGIGARRLMAAPDQFQHPAPERGQLYAAAHAQCRRTVERRIDAVLMVVRFDRERNSVVHILYIPSARMIVAGIGLIVGLKARLQRNGIFQPVRIQLSVYFMVYRNP